MLPYAFIPSHTLSYAFIRFHALFICYRMLLYALRAKVSENKKSAGHTFTGFYLRKPVKTKFLKNPHGVLHI